MASRPDWRLIAFAPWGRLFARTPALFSEIPVAIAALALFYGLLRLTHYWSAPVTTQVPIDLSAGALPVYALFSVSRIAIAYVLSLVFSVGYGYIAAHNARAERIMVPVLDTLQSIPVLSFLPGVMTSMVALFPTTQFGLELGSIILIFTGQVWNMAFSVYSSLKNLPREMVEAAEVYRLGTWQRFTQLELPQTAIGLIWNSMMAVAGGWFSLMVCEMFVLGNRDLRLPGLGSYLQTASNAGDTAAIVLGLIVMIAVIVFIDQIFWRPIIAWSDKFKFEQIEASERPGSRVLQLLRRSKLLERVEDAVITPSREALILRFARSNARRNPDPQPRRTAKWFSRFLLVLAVTGMLYATVRMSIMLAELTATDLNQIFWGAGATFLRIELTLVLAALWTIPAGVLIGLRPKLAAIFQPVAQVAASVPAPALFPILLLLLIKIGSGLGIASILLLLLGTQWYILFNVIAGASAIPSDLKEVCDIFQLSALQRWRHLLLPAIFPYLITGLVTASGGAWNASILAEYFRFRGQTFSLTGIGAVISRATDAGNLPLLLAATAVISGMVVVINRLVWRRLYTLAATRYKLELS
ncbi:MAG: ABC transporter permease subunit [Acidobacteriaceae bacterium]|nr:ABC transporter permease subunit [Acidobacteriaceae bacterium]